MIFFKFQIFVIGLCLVQVCTFPDSDRGRVTSTTKIFTNIRSFFLHHSKLINRARVLYQKQKYSNALLYFNKAIDKKRSIPEYYTERGDCHVQLNDVDKGISDYETASTMTKKQREYQLPLCKMLINFNKLEKAKEEIKELDHNTLVELANEQERLSEINKAIILYDEAISQYPHEKYYRARGFLYRKLNYLDEAISNFKAAVSLPEAYSDNSTRYDLIQALLDSGNFEEAEKEMHPLNEPDLLRLATQFLLDRKFKEAISFYTALIVKNPHEKHYRLRGLCHLEMGAPLLAIEDFKKATSLSKKYSDNLTRTILIETLLGVNNVPDALQEIQQLNYNELMELGDKFRSNAKFKEAVYVYNQAIADYPYEKCYRSRGICFKEIGNLNDAIEDFKTAVSVPQNLRDDLTRKLLIQTLLNAKMFDDAKEEMELWNNNPEIENLGDSYYSQGKFDEAICCYDMVINKNSSEPKLYRMRGRCHIQIQNMEKALSDFYNEAKNDPQLSNLSKKKERGKILFIAELYELGRKKEGDEEMLSLDTSQMVALGDELFRRSMFNEAQRAYTSAIDNDRNNASLYEKRGQFFRERKLWLQAIDDYQQALSYDQSCNDYLIELIELWLAHGDFRRAKEILDVNDQQLKKLAPKDIKDRAESARQQIDHMEYEDNVRRQREEEERLRRIEEERRREEEARLRQIEEARREEEERLRRARQQSSYSYYSSRPSRRRSSSSSFYTGAAIGAIIGASAASGCGGGGCGGGGSCGGGGCGGR